ncbi:F0F1 ATP synthase subunit A [bacterium]|nr:F0F1 ATP synthase subunit A [bacterium]
MINHFGKTWNFSRIFLLTLLITLFSAFPVVTLEAAEHETTTEHAATEEHGEGHGNTLDIVHHLTDLNNIEILFWTFSLEKLHFEVGGIDMSITKPVIFMWLALLVLLLSFTIPFRSGKLMRNKFSHLMECYIIFIRDEVVYANMGEKDGRPLLPFFLSVFFFILTCNLLGMIPSGHTATGNINVTAGLAVIAFFTIQGMGIAKNGIFKHFKAMLPSGLPVFVIPIMIPVELVGMFAKPFALCIRLFANMVAGHAVILSFFGLIFLAQSIIIAPLPLAGVLFISLLEVFIAHLQASIFTILTVLFTSMTMHPSH